MEERVRVTRQEARYLDRAAGDEVSVWRRRLNALTIDVDSRDPCVTLKGIEPEVMDIIPKINTLLKSIVNRVVTVDAPGALSFVEEPNNNQLKTLETNLSVLIEVDNSPTYRQTSLAVKALEWNGIAIKVLQGRLPSEHVVADVIVNPSVPCLELVGDVGKEILESDLDAGRSAIQDECFSHVKKNGDLLSGHMFQSGCGTLRTCSYIFHAVGPSETELNHQGIMEDLLRNCIQRCLTLGCRTLAMPLSFKCTVAVLVNALEGALDEIWSRSAAQGSTLQEIYIVDMNARRQYECARILEGKTNAAAPATAGQNAKSFVYDTNIRALTTREGLKVDLYIGDITTVSPGIDIILNSVAADVNMKGATGTITQAILSAAGSSIQKELKKKAPQGITTPGGIVSTGSYNIPEQHCGYSVYHCYLLPYDGSRNGNSVNVLRKTIRDALLLATKEGRQSVGIPAVDGGVCRTPKEVVADVLFDVVHDFSQDFPRSSVKRVVLVAYHKDSECIEAFNTKYIELCRSAAPSQPHSVRREWTVNIMPQSFRLYCRVYHSTAQAVTNTERRLRDLCGDNVSTLNISRTKEPKLNNIDNDKAQALTALQYTHHVKITATRVSDKLENLMIEGYEEDVSRARDDALAILNI